MSTRPAAQKARARAPAPADKDGKQKPRRRIPYVLQAKLDIFIEWLARTGSVTSAAEAADLSRNLLYERRRTHKTFAGAWKKALALGVDRLHDKAMHRAMEGDERPIVRNGELVATERRFDNRLLQFLLKVHKPEFAGGAPTASESEQEAMAKRLKAAARRLEAHRARSSASRAESSALQPENKTEEGRS
ncbi:MAG: hypothetical protein Q8M19_07925 [Reyranella sp.]|nr:hypothetical protein [Reyranella sp.]